VSSQITKGIPKEGPHGEQVALPGPLTQVVSTTVDSGELYVSESYPGVAGYARIDRFDASSGAFLGQLLPQVPSSSFRYFYQGITLGHSTGEAQVYVGGDEFPEPDALGLGVVAVLDTAGNVKGIWRGPDPSKAPEGLFGGFGGFGPVGIAVDYNPSGLGDWAAGDVYVADAAKGVVDVFKPLPGGGEEFLTRVSAEPGVVLSRPTSVAVSPPNGEVLVVDSPESESQSVDIFRPSPIVGQYEFVGKLSGPLAGGSFGRIAGMTVDEGNGEIYVWEDNGSSAAIDQFDAEGQLVGRLTGVPTDSSGDVRAFDKVLSVAVDPASHEVYVANPREDLSIDEVDVFGPDLVVPDVTTGPASGVRPVGEGQIEATLNGTVNPDGEGEASCSFAWGTTSRLGQAAPCEPEKVPDGSSPVEVHAVLHGLAPDTTYFFRLRASNKNGTNPGEPVQDQQFTTPGPGLHGETVSAARGESVTFDARIDPHGAPTSYYFQYGTSSAYGTDVPALSAEARYGAAIGSGEEDVEVDQHVQGLSASTVYHYRVVTVSELAPGQFEYFYGPDQTFTTQSLGVPLQLPDGRAWEMVSPPQKEGALLGWHGTLRASSNGDAFMDWTLFEPTEGKAAGAYGFEVPVFFGRGVDGWVSRTIAPPHSGPTSTPLGQGQEYKLFSEDLSRGALQPFGAFTPLASGVSESTPYIRTDFLNGNPDEICVTGCYQPLVTAANVPSGTKFGEEPVPGGCEHLFCGPILLGGTPDLSHVVLKSPHVALTDTSLEGYEGLYEWHDGALQLVNVLPEGEHNEQGGPVAIAPSLGHNSEDAAHAISDDGSRVVWEGETLHSIVRHLYLRDTVTGETVRLDAFQGVEDGRETNHEMRYLTASSDATRVFFLDGERLTVDSTASPRRPDLYEYDLNAPAGSRLTDLSVMEGPSSEPADVAGSPGVSRDGSYVYFTTAGVLAPGAEPGGCSGELEKREELCNLYVRHDGKTTFIAGLSQEDSHDWASRLAKTPDRVSPDGRWLAFMSSRNLTSYDTTDAASKHPDEEVYLYDALDNRLVCASCNPSGARPVGVQVGGVQLAVGDITREGAWIAAVLPPWRELGNDEALYQSRYLSDNGRLFFTSNDALVPQDVNGTQDVYEYEPAGVGDCSHSSPTFSERSGGCVSPISSGTSNEESVFLDASEMGGDVFFLTGAKLASQDFDNSLDVYDARECSAGRSCFAPVPVPPPACDTGESCKPAQAAQPTLFGAPPSATFSGKGNISQPTVGGKADHRSLTRRQKLARALRACHRKKRHRPRVTCERNARRRYGARAAVRAVHGIAKSIRDQSAGTGR
jgi:hypothetical protein